MFDNSFSTFVIRHQLAYLKTMKKENGVKFRMTFISITNSHEISEVGKELNKESKWILTFCQRNSRYGVVLGYVFHPLCRGGVDE